MICMDKIKRWSCQVLEPRDIEEEEKNLTLLFLWILHECSVHGN